MGWYKQGTPKPKKSRAERLAQSAEERMELYREQARVFEELYSEERNQHRRLENSIYDSGLLIEDDEIVVAQTSWEMRVAVKNTLASVVEHLADVETEEEALPAVHAALKVIRAYEAAVRKWERAQEDDE